MPRGGSSELRRVIRALQELGLQVEGGKGHLKVRDGDRLVAVMGASPSTVRWIPNLERDLRVAGVLPPGERLPR